MKLKNKVLVGLVTVALPLSVMVPANADTANSSAMTDSGATDSGAVATNPSAVTGGVDTYKAGSGKVTGWIMVNGKKHMFAITITAMDGAKKGAVDAYANKLIAAFNKALKSGKIDLTSLVRTWVSAGKDSGVTVEATIDKQKVSATPGLSSQIFKGNLIDQLQKQLGLNLGSVKNIQTSLGSSGANGANGSSQDNGSMKTDGSSQSSANANGSSAQGSSTDSNLLPAIGIIALLGILGVAAAQILPTLKLPMMPMMPKPAPAPAPKKAMAHPAPAPHAVKGIVKGMPKK